MNEGKFAAILRIARAQARADRGPVSSTREIQWRVAIDNWSDGFDWSIVPLIAGLQDAGGKELPYEVRLFLFDLVLRDGKTKIKPHLRAQEYIRNIYPILLATEQEKDRSHGDPPPSEKVKSDLAEMFRVSYSVVDQIVSPRASRKPRKGSRHQPE